MLKSERSLLLLIVIFLTAFNVSADVLGNNESIIINEIMYDVLGSDSGREWIELYNNSADTIDITEYNLETDSNHRSLILISGTTKILPHNYAVIVRDVLKFVSDYPQFFGTVFRSTFTLNNSQGKVNLKFKDKIIDSMIYDASLGAKGDGMSLQKFGNNWLPYIPTPGKINEMNGEVINRENLIQSNQKADLDGNILNLISPAEVVENIISDETMLDNVTVLEDNSAEIVNNLNIENIREDNDKKSSFDFKWLIYLLGLLIISSLPIIFTSNKNKDNKVKSEEIRLILDKDSDEI